MGGSVKIRSGICLLGLSFFYNRKCFNLVPKIFDRVSSTILFHSFILCHLGSVVL